MISISGVSKKYERIVLDNINLTVKPGNICCLLGKNGVGKSTLLKIVAGLIRADKGEVMVNGRYIKPNTVFRMNEMGLVSDQDNIINQLTGYQFLVFQCLIFRISKSLREIRIKSLVEYFFEDVSDLHKETSTFSSGMRMKLRIIASLIQNPNILILDEPFANLDPVSADKLVVLLRYFGKKSNSIVFISSHDLIYVDKIASQICVLNDTKIVFDGSKDDFTHNETERIDKTLLDLIGVPNRSIDKLSWII